MKTAYSSLYGLPVLSHLSSETVTTLYKLLFLSSLYSAAEADEILKNIFTQGKDENDISDLIANLEAAKDFDIQCTDDSSERISVISSKIKEWIAFYPDVTDSELKEYFAFHHLKEPLIDEILLDRNFIKFRSPKDIKAYLDEIVISQEEAKKVLSFGFYLHLIRIGKIKPVIHQKMQTANNLPPELPKPNLLLIGPTGSGKTLIIKSLCSLFDIPFIKVDCSSLTSSGYVGNGLNDYLKVLITKYGASEAGKSVVYFDEFDKVSESQYSRKEGSVGGVELQQEFLSLLEDKERVITRTGYETGEKHQLVNFQNVMFIFSGSFAGIEPFIERRIGERQSALGFKKNNSASDNEKSILHKVTFEDVINFGIIPELAGRIGFIGVLDKLSKDDLIKIMKKSSGNILSHYNNYFLHHYDRLIIEEEVYDLIAEEVVKRNIGARGLNGVIIELLQDLLFLAPNEFEEVFRVDREYFLKKFE